jgi:hypothetical protein
MPSSICRAAGDDHPSVLLRVVAIHPGSVWSFHYVRGHQQHLLAIRHDHFVADSLLV